MVVRFVCVIRVPVCPVCVACVSRGEDVSTPAPVLDPLPSAEDRPVSL
jgi:hypothetical protein